MTTGVLIGRIVAVLLGGYCIGAIPFSLIIGKLVYHRDLRTLGSGNLGSTNVLRVFGVKAGVAVFLCDACKGAFSVLLVRGFVPGRMLGATGYDWVLIGAVLVAVLGHAFSPYVGFHGGKGVATSCGAVFALHPLLVVGVLAVFFLIAWGTRYVSLASVISVWLYAIVVAIRYRGAWGAHLPQVVLGVALGMLVTWLHRGNLARLRAGTERKLTLSHQDTDGTH